MILIRHNLKRFCLSWPRWFKRPPPRLRTADLPSYLRRDLNLPPETTDPGRVGLPRISGDRFP